MVKFDFTIASSVNFPEMRTSQSLKSPLCDITKGTDGKIAFFSPLIYSFIYSFVCLFVAWMQTQMAIQLFFCSFRCLQLGHNIALLANRLSCLRVPLWLRDHMNLFTEGDPGSQRKQPPHCLMCSGCHPSPERRERSASGASSRCFAVRVFSLARTCNSPQRCW